ncbi:hypothetical protein NLI96_g6967 [Meripilus lineatus]|uniref:Uncharacterized protein n=1 Tax=Meripilus lineatus TaxID=2056292 RepID=A0AAD5YCH0_9APHY|nr:hypothetical protein NLI96_g6967 [Physisporinus lineatus]
MLKFIFTPGLLYIRLLHINPRPVSIPITILLEFQPQTNLPHPSFDLSHLVEIRTTIYPHWLWNSDSIDVVVSIWKHDELIDLDNLERLQIGIHSKGNNPSDKSQMELDDFLKDLVEERELDPASSTIAKLERGFAPLRECDRRYELEVTLDDLPLDDVLRGWKERMAKRNIQMAQKVQRALIRLEEGMEVEERTEGLEGDGIDSEWSDEDSLDSDWELYIVPSTGEIA